MLKFLKNPFSSPKKDPLDEMINLNKDNLKAFINRDLEHYRKVNSVTQELFTKFQQDFLHPIAEFTPEGKFERFKHGITEDQIRFVVAHAQKLVEKLQNIKNTNSEIQKSFVEDVHKEKDFHDFREEFDKVFGKISDMSEYQLRKHFKSKVGQEFVTEELARRASGAPEALMKVHNYESYQEYVRKYFPELAKIDDKYDTWFDPYAEYDELAKKEDPDYES